MYKLPIKNSFSKITNDSPIVKITLSLLSPFFIGTIIHYIPINSLYKLITSTVIMVLLIGVSVFMTINYNEKMIVLLSLLVGSTIWYYIFINNYRLDKKNKKIGKKEFICNPNGLCKKDGTDGPFNGLKDYEYNPSSQPHSKDTKIPHTEFDVRNPTQMTYMFWLKIDYNSWKSNKFYDKYKTILLKGNDFSSGDLVVYGTEKEDSLQFNINTDSTDSTTTFNTKFPFDKWVHYTIVGKNNIVELYKNATLEKSVILNNNINLKKTPLYIGKYISEYSANMPNNFPGQMIYLTYVNRNLTPGQIYTIYKKEFNILANMSDDLNDINKDNDINTDVIKCNSDNKK